MAAERIADLTLEELRSLIAEMIDARLQFFENVQELEEIQRLETLLSIAQRNLDQLTEKSISQLLGEIQNSVWERPPETKSSLELLREDRER